MVPPLWKSQAGPQELKQSYYMTEQFYSQYTQEMKTYVHTKRVHEYL